MKFSIIVPAYNTEKYIKSCLNNLVNQQPGNYEKEVLLIDDCSTDNTYQILREFRDNNKDWVRLLKNNKNVGVGLTRNIGIENASGEWLIFLDSDDKLSSNALKELSECINSINSSIDIVGYNWVYDLNSDIKSEKYGERWDLSSLLKSKNELIKEYISLGMDNSVIYASMKKNLLDAYKLRFRDGLHEDIDFLFKVYFHANKTGALNLPLYFKNNRANSIINTISEDHIKGFFRALKEIYLFLSSQNMFTEKIMKYFYHGMLRVVATEVRYIWQRYGSEDWADQLYFILHNEYISLLKICSIPQLYIRHSYEPKYIMIANYFFNLMANKPKSVHKEVANYLVEIKEKSWSCYDLHNSVFLTPDEIRTCCKRFFVNNKIKGDVAILNRSKYHYNEFTSENILKEKKGLHVRINAGIAEECMGCPYLEFKNWGSINKLRIEYISLEYSSVCNMRCSYCSDKYFAGKKAEYNVELLLRQLFEEGCLESCNTIVWGGGEPTLDSIFNKLLAFMALKFPNVKQRVFTNATRFSELINKLLKEDKILSITSIDAGNEENFYKIRKHEGFKEVFENLKRYSLSKPENLIIKYIITEHDSSLEELQSFVKYIQKYSLERCNFQISFNFKKEFVDFDSLISVIALYTYLSDINVRFIFFDDLFWQRISNELNTQYDKLLEKLKGLNLLRAFANNEKYKSVVIWGAGIQAKFLLEKSTFFKKVKIEYLVDNSAEKIGKNYFGYKVLPPEVLLESDSYVVIAAVQNIPNILSNFYKLGLSESRLIKGLVI